MQRMIMSSVVLIVVLFLTGCTNSLECQVTGRVTLDGEPLTTGNVMFHPKSGGAALLREYQQRWHLQPPHRWQRRNCRRRICGNSRRDRRNCGRG